MSQKLIDYLKDVGLSDKEAELYRQILMKKQATAKEVGDVLNMNRVTARGNIDKLVRKGLVSQIYVGSKRIFIAEKPERLKYLVEKKVNSVKKLKNSLPGILKEVKSIIPPKLKDDSVTASVHEGRKAVFSIFDEVLKADTVRTFVNIDKYYEIYPGTEDLFKEAFDRNPKRRVFDITIDTPLAREIESDEKEKYTRYHAKYIPQSEKDSVLQFPNSIEYLIYNNKVSIIQAEKNSVFGTVIESHLINLSFISLHQYIWKLLK